jgi:DNA-binding transcriptional regulator/RsmH inhibitor MraZ
LTDHPFIGNALCAVDGRGRLVLPPFVRSALSRRSDARLIFAGCHESDPCLVAYDRSFARTLAFDCRRLRLRDASMAAEVHHARARRTFGYVEQLALDSHGKVALPPMLLRRARIERSALVIGTGGAFEIWNAQSALESGDPDLSELAAFHLEYRQVA